MAGGGWRVEGVREEGSNRVAWRMKEEGEW